MTPDTAEKYSRYYVPVVREGGRFVEAWRNAAFDEEPTPASELMSFIKRHHRPVKAEVEIEGQVYSTTVFVPEREDDLSYVLTNENLVPVDSEATVEVEADEVRDYLDNIDEQLSKSEAIAPDQVISLRNQFIEPEFTTLMTESGEAQHQVSWERFSKIGRLVLLGEPGSGKTSCFRKIVLDLVDTERASSEIETIPVFLQMRLFGDTPLSVDSIQRVLANQNAETLARDFHELSHAGKFLLLLDGLDEIPDNHRNDIISNIQDICTAYPRNRVMVSSRRGVYKGEFSNFKHLELQPFSISKIKEWSCQHLYQYKTKPWRVFFSHLKDDQDCLSLTRNPLLLSLAVSQFSRHSITPHSKATLFEDFINALIERWDSARGVNRSDEPWAAPQQKLYSLCKLSYFLTNSGKVTFSSREYSQLVKASQQDIPDYKALTVLAEHTGLISKTSEDEWAFTHKSLMEYLTAYYLVKGTDDIKPALKGRLSDIQWQDILILACGITPDASHLLNFVCESTDVSPLAKAQMISEAISQNIRASEDTLNRCFDLVAMVLDKWIARLIIRPDEQMLFGASEPTQIWSLLLSTSSEDRFINTFEGSLLTNLLRSVYKLRSSPAVNYFVDQLRKSEVQAVRDLAAAFNYEGELVISTSQTDETDYLRLSINR